MKINGRKDLVDLLLLEDGKTSSRFVSELNKILTYQKHIVSKVFHLRIWLSLFLISIANIKYDGKPLVKSGNFEIMGEKNLMLNIVFDKKGNMSMSSYMFDLTFGEVPVQLMHHDMPVMDQFAKTKYFLILGINYHFANEPEKTSTISSLHLWSFREMRDIRRMRQKYPHFSPLAMILFNSIICPVTT